MLWWAMPTCAASAPGYYPMTVKEVSEERETLSPWRSISENIEKLLRLNPSDRPLGQ